MSLSIYYSGTLRDPKLIDAIITEAIDISESMHWKIIELPSVEIIPVRGILIQPAKCDPIWLSFHANGNLCNPIFYTFLLESEGAKAIDAKQVLVTKTQEAGAEVHMNIIKVMRYISEKYFSHFELTDDSRFWETGDEILCRKRFEEGDRIMDVLDLALTGWKAYPINDNIFKIKQRLRRKL